MTNSKAFRRMAADTEYSVSRMFFDSAWGLKV